MPNGVQFEEENLNFDKPRQWLERTPSSLETLVIRTGLAKNISQAKYILVGIVLMCVALIIVISLNSFGLRSGPQKPSPEVIKQIQLMSERSYR